MGAAQVSSGGNSGDVGGSCGGECVRAAHRLRKSKSEFVKCSSCLRYVDLLRNR